MRPYRFGQLSLNIFLIGKAVRPSGIAIRIEAAGIDRFRSHPARSFTYKGCR